MLWFVFFKSDMLIRKCHDGTYTVPRCDDPPIAVKHSTEIHQITPMEDGEEVRTFRVDAPITDLDDHEMCGLRASFYKLPKEIYLKAGHCHQLLFWDYTTQFCGICSGRMKKESYISKRCTVCGNEIWPSPAIAVITLIRNGDKALLVHANNFRKNFYGLVAGFVELGETLENAARREICEEVDSRRTEIYQFTAVAISKRSDGGVHDRLREWSYHSTAVRIKRRTMVYKRQSPHPARETKHSTPTH